MPSSLSLIKDICLSVVDVVFPCLCPLCGKKEAKDRFCVECIKEFVPIEEPWCVSCGKPFISGESSDVRQCGECLTEGALFEGARSAYYYKGGAAEAVKSLKYGKRTEIAEAMGQEMKKGFLALRAGSMDAIVPVPLHVNRLRSRGFNQAQRLSKALSRDMNVRIELYAIKRVRDTVPQVSLKNDKERKENIKGAFAVTDAAVFKDKKVLLVDDVTTTGSTLRECARVLRKSGAEVYAVTFAMAAHL